jgi:hypothetical protein
MPLDPKRIKEIFLAAAERPDPGDRAAFRRAFCRWAPR